MTGLFFFFNSFTDQSRKEGSPGNGMRQVSSAGGNSWKVIQLIAVGPQHWKKGCLWTERGIWAVMHHVHST